MTPEEREELEALRDVRCDEATERRIYLERRAATHDFDLVTRQDVSYLESARLLDPAYARTPQQKAVAERLVQRGLLVKRLYAVDGYACSPEGCGLLERLHARGWL